MQNRIWKCAFVAMAMGMLAMSSALAWWNKDWTVRNQLTVDTGADGANIPGPLGEPAILLRLHEGNFNFAAAREDGSDIRFLAADETTELPYHIEKYDALMNEAFVWVKAPEFKEGELPTIWLYYGNLGEGVENVQDAAATYPGTTALDYHFASQPPVDSSAGKNNAENGGVAVQGAMIGSGMRLDGQTTVKVPASATLNWDAGANVSWSAWVKPVVDQPSAAIFSRGSGANKFVIGIENGVPYLQIGSQKTGAGEPIPAGTWKHVAATVEGNTATLYVNGDSYGTIAASVPALTGEVFIGGNVDAGETQFIGELDELQVDNAALPAGGVKFLAVNQGGTSQADALLKFGETEMGGSGGGHSDAFEHVLLFGDIAHNMMFDGWIAVGVCILMMIFGWGVAILKFNYLNHIQTGTDAFMHQWSKVSTDLTALDKEGGVTAGLTGKARALVKKSPVYHLYHIGSEEISHRLGEGQRHKGLTARSIQAIRSSLETGIVRENQRMNKGLIFLTISIAGGPYVGLLGTVVGVMITFAIIAKSGEVDVNSIAPGIASALLATVFGLLVAIPALFIYSYLNARIKDLLASMQVFIDEFIAKMAEFYPPPGEGGVPIPHPNAVQSSAHSGVSRSSDH